MRFIVPGPMFPDSFAENVSHTLREMGHEVITMSPISVSTYASRLRAYYRTAREKMSREYVPPADRWLMRVVKNARADVLLAPTWQLTETALAAAKDARIRCIAWWGDPPSNMQRMGLLSELWDFLFFKDPDAVAKFRRVGLNAFLLHEAMNPAWHRPVASTIRETVVVVGNYYNYRQFLLHKLLKRGIKIELYGPPPPSWGRAEIRNAHTGKYVVKEEKSRVFGEGSVSLNTTSLHEGNSLNCRAFEAAGAGGLQIIEDKPIIAECFEPGKELLVFRTFEELLELIERAIRFPAEMSSIRSAAIQRAQAEHTYRHRLESILRRLS